MKRIVFSIFFACVLTLVGCGADDSNYDNRNGNGNDISSMPIGYLQDKENKESANDFGYSRIQAPSSTKQLQDGNKQMIDRSKMAEMISRTAVMSPNVEDVATLVTGEEVLIAYSTDTNDEKERFDIADQVKKTALSVVPRWYHVYVSDNPDLFPLIQRYQELDATTEHVEDSINDVIKEFKKSPQGRNISDGENANGEQKGETNERLEKENN